jgi:hypothetical protein
MISLAYHFADINHSSLLHNYASLTQNIESIVQMLFAEGTQVQNVTSRVLVKLVSDCRSAVVYTRPAITVRLTVLKTADVKSSQHFLGNNREEVQGQVPPSIARRHIDLCARLVCHTKRKSQDAAMLDLVTGSQDPQRKAIPVGPRTVHKVQHESGPAWLFARSSAES